MARTSNLSRPIIEALYTEALVLTDDVRAVFALGAYERQIGENEAGRRAATNSAGTLTANSAETSKVHLALSTEGLKTTTRMMHVLAWLLNQRAFFAGELSAQQVRKHGSLPPDRAADPEALARLEPETCHLIAETEKLHQRIARLDEAWRQNFEMSSPARAFQGQLARRFSDLG